MESGSTEHDLFFKPTYQVTYYASIILPILYSYNFPIICEVNSKITEIGKILASIYDDFCQFDFYISIYYYKNYKLLHFCKALFFPQKEKCYVSADYEAELERNAASGECSSSYELPDGQRLVLGDVRFKGPELFYKPSLHGFNCPSIVDVICNSVDTCDMDYRKVMYENIVVSGGSTMFPGFVERLDSEMMVRRPRWDGFKVGIEAIPSRQYCAWSGGSMLASLECLNGFWMTRQEYEDVGPDRVNYKFF